MNPLKCHSYSGSVLNKNDISSNKSISIKECKNDGSTFEQNMAISTISNSKSNASSTATNNETSDIISNKHSVNDPIHYKIESPSDSLMSPSISSVASTSEVSHKIKCPIYSYLDYFYFIGRRLP